MRVILGAASPERLSFLIPAIDGAYVFYVNGTEAVSSGKTGVSREQSVPAWKPVIVEVPVGEKPLDLMSHISNFHHARGGLNCPVVMGTESSIREYREKGVGEAEFLTVSAGCVCVIPDEIKLNDLMTAADSALYRAKEYGRNRAEKHTPIETSYL